GETEEFELGPSFADAVIKQIERIRIGLSVPVLDHLEALDDRTHRLDHVMADAGSDKRGQLRVLDHNALRIGEAANINDSSPVEGVQSQAKGRHMGASR